MVKYKAAEIEKLAQAFSQEKVAYKKNALPFGATDGASLARFGIPAVTIVGQSLEKLNPTYHTRLDVPEYVEDKALEDVKRVLIRFAKNEDERFN